MNRRAWLKLIAGASVLGRIARVRAASPRVLIIGGGWGGLAAARYVRQLAPDMEVTLLERQAAFWSRPLSNRWLVGLADEQMLVHDYQAAARRHGYRFLQAEVLEIDREQRRVVTHQETLGYDWLIIAAGIREDFAPWYGVDRNTAAYTQQHYPSAFADGDGHRRLKAKIENFKGGDWLMTIPPMPYRCPPAPYERAGMLAWWMKTRQIKGRLIVLDPNQPALSFERVFRDTYREQITYVPQAQVKSLDPYKKQVVTDFDTIDFAEATLMPPQQAADIVGRAGLCGPSGWARQHPLSLQAIDDERVFLVGDLLDKASPLFGYYPKTGQMAARQGLIAAQQIAARASGQLPPRPLPDSRCFVVNRVDPLEIAQLDTSYRLRGDGLIQQSVKQHYYPQAQDEDVIWARGMFGELGF
jgi:NADH dehydrogenase FAD-containing subunit